MESDDHKLIALCKEAAMEVLLHNANGPYQNLPRTAAWGYPEPYTRDLMFSILGVSVSGNGKLIETYKNVLETLADNQTPLGLIPSLVHDPNDLGASDTTPLFLIGVSIYRKLLNRPDFLETAVERAMLWMQYQSPTNKYLVAQQPTTDWRDEQWVMGYGLFVNVLVYIYLRFFGQNDRADLFLKAMERFTEPWLEPSPNLDSKPYYDLWSYKIYNSDRFDLLGNSLAILSGLAPRSKAIAIIEWVENACEKMRQGGYLLGELPPNFFPFIKPGDTDWRERYSRFNLPGEYHNGGIWPFICALYIAALVSVKYFDLAEKKLVALSLEVKKSRSGKVDFGFNEWIKSQNGIPSGQDWQTWSAALYLYAAKCVELKTAPFFEEDKG